MGHRIGRWPGFGRLLCPGTIENQKFFYLLFCVSAFFFFFGMFVTYHVSIFNYKLIIHSASRQVSQYIFQRWFLWKVICYIFKYCAFYIWSFTIYAMCLIWIIILSSFFYRFPYFLPCFCISLYALVVMIFAFWLPVNIFFYSYFVHVTAS